MVARAKSVVPAFHLPRLYLPRFDFTARRRRQASIDLLHSSAHLRRDIGALEENFVERRG